MKYLLLLSCFLTTSSFAMIGKVPQSWTRSSSGGEKSLLRVQEANLSELDAAYTNILDAKLGMMKDAETPADSRWFLQSIKTELAVEAEGTLGIMGAGGEAALELVWIKKKAPGSPALIPQKLEDEIASNDEEIRIRPEMTEAELQEEIAPVVDLAMATGHVKKRAGLLKNIMGHAIEFQKTAQELEASPVMGPWYVYKYQLELYVSAEGKVTLFEIGNSIRLRLEWWRLRKDGNTAFQPPMLPQELSPNAKFVTAIASDVAAVDQVNFNNGFKFNCMKIGIGTTVEGNFFFVKGKAKAVGSLFFKRDDRQIPQMNVPSLVLNVNNYTLNSQEGTSEIPRWSFRKGIEKATSISRFFANHARTKEEGQFELNVIESEFELFGSGELGLVTVEGSAVLTLFVTRNVTI